MKYKELGRTGLKSSRITLGTNNFGGQLDEEASRKVIDEAVDSGINLIDTADVYTAGRSEEIIGRAVEGRRNDLILATKVGGGNPLRPDEPTLGRKHIMRQAKESLSKLRTSYIDVYYIHVFKEETPLEETLRAMDELVRENKVRHVACSNFTVEQMARAQETCERLGLAKIEVVQPPYNLLRREIEEQFLPWCQENDLGVLTYTPLNRGFLTGKYAPGAPPPPGSRGAFDSKYLERNATERNVRLVDEIREVAESAGVSMAALAIAWILRNPAVTAPIVGASTPEQVRDASAVPDMDIPESVFEELDEVTKQP